MSRIAKVAAAIAVPVLIMIDMICVSAFGDLSIHWVLRFIASLAVIGVSVIGIGICGFILSDGGLAGSKPNTPSE